MYMEIGFKYKWKSKPTYRSGILDESDQSMSACRALERADLIVHEAAESCGVRMEHCYGWPDGTLVKWVDVPAEEKCTELVEKVAQNREMEISVAYSEVREPEYQTHRDRALSEVFNGGG